MHGPSELVTLHLYNGGLHGYLHSKSFQYVGEVRSGENDPDDQSSSDRSGIPTHISISAQSGSHVKMTGFCSLWDSSGNTTKKAFTLEWNKATGWDFDSVTFILEDDGKPSSTYIFNRDVSGNRATNEGTIPDGTKFFLQTPTETSVITQCDRAFYFEDDNSDGYSSFVSDNSTIDNNERNSDPINYGSLQMKGIGSNYGFHKAYNFSFSFSKKDKKLTVSRGRGDTVVYTMSPISNYEAKFEVDKKKAALAVSFNPTADSVTGLYAGENTAGVNGTMELNDNGKFLIKDPFLPKGFSVGDWTIHDKIIDFYSDGQKVFSVTVKEDGNLVVAGKIWAKIR